MNDIEIKDWPGGHLHRQGPQAAFVGPINHWKRDDRMRLPGDDAVWIIERIEPDGIAFALRQEVSDE